MRSTILVVLLITNLFAASHALAEAKFRGDFKFAQDDWPWWRGPTQDGVAPANQTPPLKWSEDQNVIWKADVPGRGHGSPTVVGNQVLITIADRQRDVQSVRCHNRETGELEWETVLHRGGLMKKNQKASQASTTVACDGKRLYATFLNDGAVFLTALERGGDQLWQKRISSYKIHQGYAASPTIYQSLVIVAADNKGGGAIMALDRVSGDMVWKRDRPKKPNYPSAIVLHAAGKDQLIMMGCDMMTSLNPLTGETNWETEGATTECVVSTVTDGKHVYSSGGYPKNHVAAMRADGSNEVVWENGSRVYVPSMVIKDGFLYAILDAGIAACWNAATGEEMWKKRLGGDFSSSAVLVGDRVYATNEDGTTFVFKASPEKYESLGKNKLGDSAFATPAICGDRIYNRVAHDIDGKRQEVLYCIGTK